MKKLLIAFLFAASLAWGQGSSFTGQAIGENTQGFLIPIPGASVQVCSNATCTAFAQIFNDATLTPPAVTQPIAADAGGNYTFWAAPGNYWCAVGAPGFSGLVLPCSVPNVVAINNYVDTVSNQTVAGNKTLTGTTTLTGPAFLSNLNSIRFADQFSGADCGSKINTADADLGGAAGEIWVSQACGLTIATPVSLSPKHVLRFIQGGTWAQSAKITLADGSGIVGIPSGYNEDVLTLQDPAVVLKQSVSTNLPLLLSIAGQNVTLESFGIDGNARGGGNGSTKCVDIDLSNPAPNSRGRFHMYRMTVENCAAGNVFITSGTSGNNQAIGAVITDSAINRSLSGNGLMVSRTTDFRMYRTYIELNGGYGVELLDSVAQIINSDISTNNSGQVYSHVDSLAHTVTNMQGGSMTLIGNGISSSGATSGLSENLNSSIVINGYNGTDCNQDAGNLIAFNSVNFTGGMQTNAVDGIRIIDSGSNKVFGNNILSGPSASFEFKNGVSIATVNCGSENSDILSTNNFFGTFGTSYNILTSTDSAGNTVGAIPQEQWERTNSTCATAASVGASCDVTVTWPVAFADTSYTATCSGDGITSGIPVNGGFTKAAGSVTFKTVAATAAAAQYAKVGCQGHHD